MQRHVPTRAPSQPAAAEPAINTAASGTVVGKSPTRLAEAQHDEHEDHPDADERQALRDRRDRVAPIGSSAAAPTCRARPGALTRSGRAARPGWESVRPVRAEAARGSARVRDRRAAASPPRIETGQAASVTESAGDAPAEHSYTVFEMPPMGQTATNSRPAVTSGAGRTLTRGRQRIGGSRRGGPRSPVSMKAWPLMHASEIAVDVLARRAASSRQARGHRHADVDQQPHRAPHRGIV